MLLRLFSGLEILVEHRSLYDKYGFQAARQPIYDNFGSTNSFWNQYFSVNQRDFWEREKRGLISYLSAWDSDQRVLLKNTAQPEKARYIYKKW